MPLPAYLGICPYCQARVAVASKICVNCGHMLRTGEAQKAAQEKGLYTPDKKPGIRGWFTDRRRAPRIDVQLETQVQPRLLISVSFAGEPKETAGALQPVKLIGSARNISESGLAIVVPSVRVGFRSITEENAVLRILLDINQKGLIEMEAMTVRSEQVDAKDKDKGHLIGVCITNISESDRARYLEYLEALRFTRTFDDEF